MDQTKLCEGEMSAGMGIEVPPKDESAVNSWVTRVILVTLQIIVAISIFQMFRDIILTNAGAASSNLYLGILGCTLATICACLLLLKYQKLIQQFCGSIPAGGAAQSRTYALEKANEEMRLEIAERGRVEKALMESEEQFRTIIREAALGIALIDKQGRVIEGNPALLAMLGYAAGELQGMEFTRISHPENAASSWEKFQQLLTGRAGCLPGGNPLYPQRRLDRLGAAIHLAGAGARTANPNLPSPCSRTLPNAGRATKRFAPTSNSCNPWPRSCP